MLSLELDEISNGFIVKVHNSDMGTPNIEPYYYKTLKEAFAAIPTLLKKINYSETEEEETTE